MIDRPGTDREPTQAGLVFAADLDEMRAAMDPERLTEVELPVRRRRSRGKHDHSTEQDSQLSVNTRGAVFAPSR